MKRIIDLMDFSWIAANADTIKSGDTLSIAKEKNTTADANHKKIRLVTWTSSQLVTWDWKMQIQRRRLMASASKLILHKQQTNVLLDIEARCIAKEWITQKSQVEVIQNGQYYGR